MNLEKMKEQLVHWMGEMKDGYRDPEAYIYVEENCIKIKLFTLTNDYCITAICKEKSYLGCVASNRTPMAGEDWMRGNDLADGEFSKETWKKILADIVGYELVKIHRPVEELYKSRQ